MLPQHVNVYQKVAPNKVVENYFARRVSATPRYIFLAVKTRMLRASKAASPVMTAFLSRNGGGLMLT